MLFNIMLSYPDINENFAAVMKLVANGLRTLGHQVSEINRFQPGSTNIIFGFYIHPEVARTKSIVYQLEPASPRTMRGNIPLAQLRLHTVWDYSRYNIHCLKTVGVSAVYVPIGYASLDSVPKSQQDIDVLFYGAMHPRRVEIIQKLRKVGLKVEAAFGVFGGRLDALIARSKVVLNLHGDDDFHTFESVRVAHLLSNHKAVVAEVNVGDDTDGFGGAVLGVPYDSLVDACVFLVKSEERRKEYEDEGFECMKLRIEPDILRRALEETYGPHQ